VETQDAVIFDCDGTLVNVESIIGHLTGQYRNFHRFHRESVNCPPNDHVVQAAVEAYEAGLTLLIVTARVKRYWPETQFWLRHNLPVPYEKIYMRADGDFRPDGVVKLEILDMIKQDGYNVIHAWDDNPVVIDVWRRQGIPVTVVESHWY
jgi:hypothetical protein